MPATAGRVKMPHNNRVSSSSALKMTGIWTNTIGYDPYAAEGSAEAAAASALEDKNAYEQSQTMLQMAKQSNVGADARGACKKCGVVGHLTFQCRNNLQLGTLAAVGEVDGGVSSDDDVSSVSDVSDSSGEDSSGEAAPRASSSSSRKKVKAEENKSKSTSSSSSSKSKDKKRRRSDSSESPPRRSSSKKSKKSSLSSSSSKREKKEKRDKKHKREKKSSSSRKRDRD
jgi:Zinc knuckle